jgi:hypothetical protein
MYLGLHRAFGNLKGITALIHMTTVLCRFEAFPAWVVFVREAENFVKSTHKVTALLSLLCKGLYKRGSQKIRFPILLPPNNLT